jgi:hypothetical protein
MSGGGGDLGALPCLLFISMRLSAGFGGVGRWSVQEGVPTLERGNQVGQVVTPVGRVVWIRSVRRLRVGAGRQRGAP